MEFLLKSKRTNKGTLELHIPLLLRLSLSAIGLIILAASLIPILEGPQTQQGVTTIVLMIILLFGALYEERWTFDPASRTISFRFGLVFLAKTMKISYDQVDEITLEKAIKGKMQNLEAPAEPSRPQNSLARFFQPKVFINLALYLKDSERLIIESGNAKKEAQLINLKKEIQEILLVQ
ncbi:hypothetical protein [Gracilinema caldarium]|uniref:DUF304 domain-containing protein n=1 Tax=Gracilinema caldarium (strain ATCC 51460 / DSM 7334 / H1) TaxID=744872 RepID=F8F120_GRAC1|nr:hypothetical protein [Gracilinema caldarium]AEJ20810.1 hypothetical protein Spica_2713 [Gracilinema caldarium DSM 7334]